MNKTYLSYWTGVDAPSPSYVTKKHKGSSYSIRCYFDNDSDELINHKGRDGLVDLDEYREMVRSLKGMGYNAIDIHDQLGRAEFYLWDSYKKYWDFKGDINHIEAIIDMIHEEGMMVQIPMYLAWGFDPIGNDAECWEAQGDLWQQKWRSYMDGPLGKGDIFLLRPRSPVYDTPYRCQCDACTAKGTGGVMTEVFASIEEIILSRKPDAKLICDLYAEGYGQWYDLSFKVSDHWLLLVADSGFGKMPDYPELGTGKHKWGIYLHAGFWLNHTIQDPHIDAFEESLQLAEEKCINDYILVNGQSFKNFIFNIEAVMAMIYLKEEFDRFDFVRDWLMRIFGITDRKHAVKADRLLAGITGLHKSMAIRPAYLDQDSDVDRGFTGTVINIVYGLIDQINGSSSGDFADGTIPFDEGALPYGIDKARALTVEARGLLGLAEGIENDLTGAFEKAWNDQFTLPLQMMSEMLVLCERLFEAKEDSNKKEAAKDQLQKLIQIANGGSKLTAFEHWHNITHARMHHPIPGLEVFE